MHRVLLVVWVTAGTMRAEDLSLFSPSPDPVGTANVLSVGNRLEMRRVDAGGITAEMIHFQSSGDGTNEEFVRIAVSFSHPAIDGQRPVALGQATGPLPAAGGGDLIAAREAALERLQVGCEVRHGWRLTQNIV
jgi:hypothetical protein